MKFFPSAVVVVFLSRHKPRMENKHQTHIAFQCLSKKCSPRAQSSALGSTAGECVRNFITCCLELCFLSRSGRCFHNMQRAKREPSRALPCACEIFTFLRSLLVCVCVLFKRFPLGMPELSHSFVAFSLVPCLKSTLRCAHNG
jgi:hypothetical protein